MSFPKYANYTESQLDYIGSIPSNWDLVPFFSRFIERKESNKGMKNDNLLSLSYGRIIHKDINSLDGLLPASYETYQVVYPGDLVFRLTDLQNDKRSLRSAIVADEGIITSAYLAVRPKAMNPGFANHLFRCYDQLKVFYSMGGGLRQSMKYDDMKWLPVVCPSLPEQTQIARFLDHETAKIDALIAEQKRLIKLLQEKLHSLILSDIKNHNLPEERLQHLVDVVRRPVTQLPDEDYVALGLFNRGRGLFHKPAKKRDEMGDSDFFWIKQGDLIISGQFAWEGAVAMATELETGKVVSHRYPVIRGRRGGILTEYLFALLTTSHGDFLLNENSRGAAGRNRPLNLNSLLKEKIKIPSISKQELVANLVHRVNQIKLETQMQKELLLERRSTLISAVVTGKIDVRGWQPPADESAFDEDVQKAGMEASA